MYWQIYNISKGRRAWLLRLINTSREASVAQRARVGPGVCSPRCTFPRAPGSCFPPQLCFPPCSGPGKEPQAAHHCLHEDKLLEILCFPPRRGLLIEAKTCPETTELKTRCVQILIKGRSLPKQQPGEISNSTLEVAPSSVKLQKKKKLKKRKKKERKKKKEDSKAQTRC